MVYSKENQIKLSDTDAAGILFFANYIKLAHDVYEEFIADMGFSLSYIINETDYYLLIAHTEADFIKSLKLSEKYKVNLKVEKIGRSSFKLFYEFYDNSQNMCATIQTVHVTVDKNSRKPIGLPDEMKLKLKEYI